MNAPDPAEIVARMRLRELDHVAVAPLAVYLADAKRHQLRRHRKRNWIRLTSRTSLAAVVIAGALVVGVALPGLRVTPAATPTSAVTPRIGADPLDVVQVLVGSVDGSVYRVGKGVVDVLPVCPGRAIATLRSAPDGRRAFVVCGARSNQAPTASILDLRTGHADLLPMSVIAVPAAAAWSPDGGSVAVATQVCAGTELCSTSVVLYVPASATQRTLLPAPGSIREVRWTALGLSVYVVGPPTTGTYVLEADRWRFVTARRLVVADAAERALLDEPSLGSLPGGHRVWERRGQIETLLTDPEREDAYALALVESGGAIVYRVAGVGSIATYELGGRFTERQAEFCASAERHGDWLLCIPPGRDHIAAYAISSGEIYTIPIGAGVQLAPLAISLIPR